MKRKLTAIILVLAAALTALFACGTAAGAAKPKLAITGTLADGYYTIDLTGLTKKQYTTFINNENGFRVNLFTPDEKLSIFIAADLTKKSAEPAIPQYNGGHNVYCGISGRTFLEYSTWSEALSLDGIYSTAADGSCGFRWKFKADDEKVKDTMPYLTSCTKLTAIFEDVYRNSVSLNKIGSSVECPVEWKGETITVAVSENDYHKKYTTAAVSVPASDYAAFTRSKNSTLELGLYCGGMETEMKMTSDGNITYVSKQGEKEITKSMFVDAKAQNDGTVVFAFSFKNGSAAAKALAKQEIYGSYKMTSGKKVLAGGDERLTLRGKPAAAEAPAKMEIELRGNSRNNATLGWSKMEGADGCQVYWSVNGGKFKKLETVKTEPRVYFAEGLNVGENTYRFRMRAYVKPVGGKTLYGAWSDIITVK